jgi:hypothetical protein
VTLAARRNIKVALLAALLVMGNLTWDDGKGCDASPTNYGVTTSR